MERHDKYVGDNTFAINSESLRNEGDRTFGDKIWPPKV